MIAAMSRRPSPLPNTAMRRCAVLALDLVGPVASPRSSASRRSGTWPGGRRDQEIAEAGGRAVLVGEPHDHVEAAVALDDLRHPRGRSTSPRAPASTAAGVMP